MRVHPALLRGLSVLVAVGVAWHICLGALSILAGAYLLLGQGSAFGWFFVGVGILLIGEQVALKILT